jgi:hypothetical protein
MKLPIQAQPILRNISTARISYGSSMVHPQWSCCHCPALLHPTAILSCLIQCCNGNSDGGCCPPHPGVHPDPQDPIDL